MDHYKPLSRAIRGADCKVEVVDCESLEDLYGSEDAGAQIPGWKHLCKWSSKGDDPMQA